jgi:hypothetical protein
MLYHTGDACVAGTFRIVGEQRNGGLTPLHASCMLYVDLQEFLAAPSASPPKLRSMAPIDRSVSEKELSQYFVRPLSPSWVLGLDSKVAAFELSMWVRTIVAPLKVL